MEVSKSDREDPYRLIARLEGEGKEDVAYAKYAEFLNGNFDDAKAMYGLARLYLAGEHYGLAYNLFRVVASFKKGGPGPWNGMGMCHAETYDLDAALSLFRRALQLDDKDPNALGNLALVHVLRCEPEKALKFANLALEADPAFDSAKHHRAYANLLLRNWEEGWKGHQEILGKVKTRTERFYENKGKTLPRWNGEHGQTVLVYGEQGLGDEISFASCIPDLAKISKEVIFDCDHRLENLFKLSFPDVVVYGTRFKNPGQWIDEHDIDARVAIGDLPRFFRNKTEDFPGTAYLKAPERPQWNRLLGKKIRPAIGIAWTGGRANTGSVTRSLALDDFEPILKAIPATWVSLEYKDRSEEIRDFTRRTGIDICNWEGATRSDDYADTAGLVAQLDLIISVTTAGVHLSGALGKECWCLAPNNPRWFYGMDGDLPWYKSVKMFRQYKSGVWPVEEIARLLKLRWLS